MRFDGILGNFNADYFSIDTTGFLNTTQEAVIVELGEDRFKKLSAKW